MDFLLARLSSSYTMLENYPYVTFAVISSLLAVILGFCYTIYIQRQPIKLPPPKKATTTSKSKNKAAVKKDKDVGKSEEHAVKKDKFAGIDFGALGCPLMAADELTTGQWPVDKDGKSEEKRSSEVDPVAYCGHIQSEMKKAQHRVAAKAIEEEMTQDQKASEQDIQRQQLENIFKLMNDQKEKFGVENMDDVNDQMKLYM